MTPAIGDRGPRPFSAQDLRLYHVTDAALSAPRGVAEVTRLVVRGGATMVQVRTKETGGREALELLQAVALAVGEQVPVLIDDRADVFLAARERGLPVAGVHVGQSDLPAADVRQICGPRAVVGLSAASLEQIRAAQDLPQGTVDYLGIGAVRATATKPDAPEPLGVEGFGRLAALSRLPAVAIGGIDHALAGPLMQAGADGVAVVSALCAAPDPRAAAVRLRAAVDGAAS